MTPQSARGRGWTASHGRSPAAINVHLDRASLELEVVLDALAERNEPGDVGSVDRVPALTEVHSNATTGPGDRHGFGPAGSLLVGVGVDLVASGLDLLH